MSKRILLFISILPFLSIGQGLPRYMTAEEKAMLPNYEAPSFRSVAPVGSNIRNVAEWEEQQAVMLTWTSFTGILTEIVRHSRLQAKVIIVCADSTQVKATLTSNNVPLSNVEYIEQSYNSIWSRDYGPNFVYLAGDDSLVIVDWIYNRVRPLDDVIPAAIAQHLGIPIYTMTSSPDDLVHTGGNYMSDGFGTAFSSELVVEENGPGGSFNQTVKSVADINDLMNEYMGINEYALMTVLPYDGIHHIDMHMKLLNEETLLVGEYPNGTLDGPQIEANLQYVLSNYTTRWGTPFKVIRIPMPPNTSSGGYSQWSPYMTYANSIFVNRSILIPTYYEEYDTVAQRIYEEALPGYNVIGINCNPIIPSGGAIHCITHEIATDDPLVLSYKQLEDTLINGSVPVLNIPIQAEVSHQSGISSVDVYWSQDTTLGYSSMSMARVPGTDNQYTATIPLSSPAGKVWYYVAASAFSGKTISKPLPGPHGPHEFEVMTNFSVEDKLFENINVFPNPASAITCIEIDRNSTGKTHIRLLDLQGKEILEIHSSHIGLGKHHYFFDASVLNNGTYILLIEGKQGRHSERIVVNH